MKSTHKRNVAAMQAAPKCQALTRAGLPCKKPALKGTPLCKSHAFEPVPTVRRSVRAADQRRAYIELQQEIGLEVREIEKMVRWAKLNEVPCHLIDGLSESRRRLAELADRDTANRRTATSPRLVAGPAVRARAGFVPMPANEAVRPTLAKTHDELAADRTRDQALGAMLGLAVGEAVGVTTTGFERSTREWSEMHGGGKLGLKPGEWAWDTAAMLALADTLLEQPSFDEQDFIERLVEHRDHGSYSPTGEAVGLGGMTAVALNNFAQFGEIPASDPAAARPTNGCLARMAPVAIRFWKQPDEMLAIARRQSAATHAGDGLAQLSKQFVEMIALALADHSKAELLSGRFIDKRSCQTLTYGQLREVPQNRIISGHDAEDSFAAALWCVAAGDGFEGAVLKALNLAGDATSIGAMAGQLAGAIYGARAIPAHWLEQLAGRERIEDVALRLFDAGVEHARSSRR
jgi:ADP-ribosyl-[dinitrogen reductase] hydrolase